MLLPWGRDSMCVPIPWHTKWKAAIRGGNGTGGPGWAVVLALLYVDDMRPSG